MRVVYFADQTPILMEFVKKKYNTTIQLRLLRVSSDVRTSGNKYLRIDQVKFVEESL